MKNSKLLRLVAAFSVCVIALCLVVVWAIFDERVLPDRHAPVVLALNDRPDGLWLFMQRLQKQRQKEVTSGAHDASTVGHTRIASNSLAPDRLAMLRDLFFVKSLQYAKLGKPVNPGLYRVTNKDSYARLWRRFYQGAASYQAITITEGWTFAQALSAIARNPYLTHTLKLPNSPNSPNSSDLSNLSSLANLSDATSETDGYKRGSDGNLQTTAMVQIGHALEMPEGRFAPDTYYFAAGSTDISLLKSAYRQLQDWLQQEWQARTTDEYKCPYQALIVASLLEREARGADEMELVAGVILTRLRLRMRLQIDASVIYGLGEQYDGSLTRNEIRKSDSAYNTYRHYGLPPTPICLPSRQAIRAALHPRFGYLYYVAKGDGSHHFSKTLAEHNRAVRQYIIKNKT